MPKATALRGGCEVASSFAVFFFFHLVELMDKEEGFEYRRLLMVKKALLRIDKGSDRQCESNIRSRSSTFLKLKNNS